MTNYSASAIQNRHQKLSSTLPSYDLDAFAFNPGPSLKYLTDLDFHLSERPVVVIFIPESALHIILPELEMAKIADTPFTVKGFPYGENPAHWADVFKAAMQAARLRSNPRIGIEPRVLRVLEMDLLKAALPQAEFVAAETAIANLRMYKDDTELIAMQKAAQIAQAALTATLPEIKAGVKEQEIAALLSMNLLQQGSNPKLPFFPIVSTGPNSANPHAYPSERKLAKGDLLVNDWGANIDGYFSDITRTFAIGEIDPEYKKIAQIVLSANQAAHQTAGPGVRAGEVDRAAREVIETAGYGPYFTHRTGHGLGLEGHEEPYIRGDSDFILQAGMTFTIEPGIYLSDRSGVRIEDDVVITPSGCRSLTDLPRELITLG